MFDKEAFKGKRILITGGGSGLGRAAARFFGGLGANIIIIGRNRNKLEETAEQISGIGSVICVDTDLCQFGSYSKIFEKCTEQGKLDGLLHCAGVALPTPVKALSVTLINEVFNINFVSFMLLVKEFQKKRYSNDGASIVGFSAINAHYPQKHMCIYEASKMALEGAIHGMSMELYQKRKIRINAMVIGPVVTPMTGFKNDDSLAVGSYSDVLINLMGFASPLNIAQMAAFLLSDLSAYTTGRNFYVDGGCNGARI